MKSKIIQPFNYIGQVTVSAICGKTTFYKYSSHNAGTIELFEGLCNLLAGESYDSQKARMPQFIRLYNKINANDAPTELTYSAAKYNTTIQVKQLNDNNYVTVFHFAIPSSQIKKEDKLINHLRLFGAKSDGGASDKVLATMDIETGAINAKDLTTNTQYIVEWSLGFSNKDGSSIVQPTAPASLSVNSAATENNSINNEANSNNEEPLEPEES